MELLKVPEPDDSEKASTNSEAPKCQICFGSGWEVVKGKGARPCGACRPASQRTARLLAQMPARYASARLADLVPRPELHENQAKIVEYMKQNPSVNYYFCGENDTGKTHFLWCLYAEAVITGRRVITVTLHDWIEKNIAAFRADQTLAESSPFRLSDLQQNALAYSVFIDDIDKKKMSEYVGEMVFNFVDSVYRHKHQLVVTSQLDPAWSIRGRKSLEDHFGDSDSRYGLAIARRIVNDETAIWRMF